MNKFTNKDIGALVYNSRLGKGKVTTVMDDVVVVTHRRGTNRYKANDGKDSAGYNLFRYDVKK